MAEPMQVGLEVTRAIRKMDRHLQAAVDAAQGLETPDQRAQAFEYLSEMVSQSTVTFGDGRGRVCERPTFLREVMARRAAAFQALLDAGYSYARLGKVVGLTRPGAQSVLVREGKRDI